MQDILKDMRVELHQAVGMTANNSGNTGDVSGSGANTTALGGHQTTPMTFGAATNAIGCLQQWAQYLQKQGLGFAQECDIITVQVETGAVALNGWFGQILPVVNKGVGAPGIDTEAAQDVQTY